MIVQKPKKPSPDFPLFAHDSGTAIKIGITKDLPNRLSTLQIGNPNRNRLAWNYSGGLGGGITLSFLGIQSPRRVVQAQLHNTQMDEGERLCPTRRAC